MLRNSPPSSWQSSWHWIEIAGPDARDYLHRLTTTHVQALEPGQGAPGCLLSPLGKIQAWFHLWCLEGGRFGVELDAGASGKWLKLFHDTIERMHFAEKFEVTEPGGLESRWLFPDAAADLAPLAVLSAGETKVIAGGAIRICHHGARDFGRDWIAVWGTAEALKSLRLGEPVAPEELERWRIEAVRPRVDAEVDESTVPLEVGLLDALAENKGCYPGQEVIERTISLGSPARRLVLVEFRQDVRLAPGEALLAAESPSEIGRITSAVPGRALALVRKINAKPDLRVRSASGAAEGRISALSSYKAEA